MADDIQERTLLETLRLSRSRDILTAISQYEARHCVPHDPEHGTYQSLTSIDHK